MDDLLAEFVAESREMLEALGCEIVAWEADPADRARLDAIFRFVHTVKGNCGFFDFPRLQALSHAAEDALADVRAGRRQPDAVLVDAVLAIIDRIGDMVDAIDAGEEFPDGGDPALIRALEPDADARETLVQLSPTVGDRPARPAAQRSIRLPVELLDRVMSGVSDMVLARNDLARRLREVPHELTVDGPFERLSSIIADVRDAITRTRMQRIESLFAALPRLVRDLSAELGKQVMVDVDGAAVELDREMIEMLRDPLTHIIRNAIDHGVEAPAERRAAGKREIGLLTVSARQSGNQILIEIADDGRGIDGARLVDQAISAGILQAAEAARLSARERQELVFAPGLSTAEAVTAISGRGVGMDVVRANIEKIGGAIELDSVVDRGTRVTLRVPLTLTIIPALTLGIGGQQFALPRSSIEEIVCASEQSLELSRLGEAMVVKVRDRRLPCLVLADVLGIAAELSAVPTIVVLRLSGGDQFALIVDQLLDHEELVVKPLSPAVMSTGLYAGTTLTDDGNPILLLEVEGIATAGGLRFDAQDRSARASIDETQLIETAARVLIFLSLDGVRRAVRMAVVDRVEAVAAFTVQRSAGKLRVVIGERILALAGADHGALPDGDLQILRLTDGTVEIAYAVREVIDLARLTDGLVPASVPGEIEGVTIIDGEAVEVLDTHWLIAEHGSVAPTARMPVCRLPASDPWIENFMRPLVEAAGYQVVYDGFEGQADLAIAADETTAGDAAKVIQLRSHPDECHRSASIYRYDRAALVAALVDSRRVG